MIWTFDDNMVNEWVVALPKRCFCGGKCYKVKDYKYACRCSECSCYHHIKLLSCEDFEDYDRFLCCSTCHNNELNVYELIDGRLAKVCGNCAEWLNDEGFINTDPVHSCRVIRQDVFSCIRFRNEI